ncbi:uncharacterized protein AruCF_3954 [Achromobacter ruhlandii]|nr:uncharacterized protein AruCF_3954 [Achromobacter ruhlandii]
MKEGGHGGGGGSGGGPDYYRFVTCPRLLQATFAVPRVRQTDRPPPAASAAGAAS